MVVVRQFSLLPHVRILPATEFSSALVSRRPDAPPCCCAPKPPGRIVPGSHMILPVPPTHSGSCGASRPECQAAGTVAQIPWPDLPHARRPDMETTVLPLAGL